MLVAITSQAQMQTPDLITLLVVDDDTSYRKSVV